MPDFSSQKQDIRAVKAQIDAQRRQLGQDIRKVSPSALVLEKTASTVSLIKTAMPVLRPAIISLAQNGFTSRKGQKLLSLGLLLGIGYGTWKLMNHSKDQKTSEHIDLHR